MSPSDESVATGRQQLQLTSSDSLSEVLGAHTQIKGQTLVSTESSSAFASSDPDLHSDTDGPAASLIKTPPGASRRPDAGQTVASSQEPATPGTASAATSGRRDSRPGSLGPALGRIHLVVVLPRVE